MKNETPANQGFFGQIDMTDFDIGIGWQTRGNFDSWSSWALNLTVNHGIGAMSPKYYAMIQLSLLGFYLRLYVHRPEAMDNFNNEKGNHYE